MGGGLYCDGAVGAAVATGDGEEVSSSRCRLYTDWIENCWSNLCVIMSIRMFMWMYNNVLSVYHTAYSTILSVIFNWRFTPHFSTDNADLP